MAPRRALWPLRCLYVNVPLPQRRGTRLLEVLGFNVHEVELFVDEIFRRQCYVDDTACDFAAGDVVDIGANCGLFALQAGILAGPAGRVLAVEASPHTYQALQGNLACWKQETNLELPLIETCNCAVGRSNKDAVSFTAYPNASGWGTVAPREMVNVVAGEVDSFINNLLGPSHSQMKALPLARLGHFFAAHAPPLFEFAKRCYITWLHQGATQISVPQKTLSSIIEDYGIQNIACLKIDVEGAEMDVLDGLTAMDWQIIQYITVETHTLTLKDAVERRLQEHFTAVIVKQDPELQGSRLHILQASGPRVQNPGHVSVGDVACDSLVSA